MELKIKTKVDSPGEIKRLIELIKSIEKEHSCHCTLLEIETD